MSSTILIVDDSLTVRMDLAHAFEAAGFSVIPCADVAAARAALTRAPVGVVVLDVVLPDADGVEFLKEIRAMPSMTLVPVLMLSSEAEVKDRIRGLKTGAAEYVGKPYDTGYVVERARELLGTKLEVSQKGTILIIDDSATFREELRHALENAGYHVIVGSNGEDGLRLAASSRPSAIVVDGMMPGIDGATVIRKIRLDAVLRDTPCLMLTASEDDKGELRALDAGADAFVRKEESLDMILARIAAVLRNAVAGGHGKTASLLGPKKILAVDDSVTYLQELAEMLRGEDYDVVLARSGEEALDMLAVQSVDCILLDLLMPGMGGREACRQIKLSPVVRDIPLIMLTAVEDRSSMIEGLSLGADDFIQKSSEFEILKARVRAQIRRKQFEDEHRRIREQLLHTELEAEKARAAQELAETKLSLLDELEIKNKELEAFSYSVSHDLRAPLRAIAGFSQMLWEEYGSQLDAEAQRKLGIIQSETKRMGNLIDDLLEFSRLGRKEMKCNDLDMEDMIRNLYERLRSQHPGPEVEFLLDSLPQTRGDRALLEQVWANLLSNALKFSAKREKPIIQVGAISDDKDHTYFVRDNGAGFDPRYQSKLFGVFQRLHRTDEFAGTGIGLALVHQIVTRHGGRVWADSKPNDGATFYFTLPRKTLDGSH